MIKTETKSMIITKNQVYDRWDTLTEKLREALFSPEYADIVWSIGGKRKMEEDQIHTLATAAGDVVMGFVSSDPSQFSKELMARLSLEESVAAELARELDAKIFSNLKDDITKVFSPPESKNDKNDLPPFNPKVQPAEPATVMNDIVPGNGNSHAKEMQPIPKTEEAPEESHIDEPFILHREDVGMTRDIPKEEPFVRFEPQRFTSSNIQPTAKPATARIEGLNSEPKKERVVHYSNERTPLEDKGV